MTEASTSLPIVTRGAVLCSPGQRQLGLLPSNQEGATEAPGCPSWQEPGCFRIHPGERLQSQGKSSLSRATSPTKIYGNTWCWRAGLEAIKPISEQVWQEAPNRSAPPSRAAPQVRNQSGKGSHLFPLGQEAELFTIHAQRRINKPTTSQHPVSLAKLLSFFKRTRAPAWPSIRT